MPESPDAHKEQGAYVGDSEEILQSIVDMWLDLVSGATRCRCVGIRLEREGDFPLVRWVGFSERFVELEKSLLPRDVKRDLSAQQRLMLLECLCGRVIRGEREGCEALLTPRGSLWMRDVSQTDKLSPEVMSKTRGVCLEEGFQSIALVPCLPDKQTIALLHVCDKRRGLLSQRLVNNLEKTGSQFARLVYQLRELRKAQARLRETKARLSHVLVVDDEREIASLVQRMLEAEEHRVTTASSAEGALEIMSEQKIDLVITDFAMPGMTGTALAGEIKRRWRPYSPPVILMSGTSSEEAAIGEEQPPDLAAFLRKPFSAEALISAARTVLA